MTKKLLENIDAIPALKESVIAVEKVYQDVDSGIEDMQKAITKIKESNLSADKRDKALDLLEKLKLEWKNT
ncbi:MAG: hypothetical protein ABGW85_05950, partial [Sulfurimonas sp.]